MPLVDPSNTGHLKEYLEYARSLKGQLVPSAHLMYKVSKIPGGLDAANEAADALIETRNTPRKERGPDFRTADCVIEDFLEVEVRDGRDPRYGTLLDMALIMAKQDPMYWGVSDPEREAYCSGASCRQARPIEDFREHEHKCYRCS